MLLALCKHKNTFQEAHMARMSPFEKKNKKFSRNLLLLSLLIAESKDTCLFNPQCN